MLWASADVFVFRYDKMSARELFRQWGVSQRCYEEFLRSVSSDLTQDCCNRNGRNTVGELDAHVMIQVLQERLYGFDFCCCGKLSAMVVVLCVQSFKCEWLSLYLTPVC